MSKKIQYTLAAFGFTKSVAHRGEVTAVDIPFVVPDELKLKCQHCAQEFRSQQGLSVHLMCKHPATPAGDEISCNSKSTSQDDKNLPSTSAATVTEAHQHDQPIEVPDSDADKRRGRDVRKSITNKFKARAIAEIEQGEKPIDVAEKYNVNRCQISKWLKMKHKIVYAAVKENKNMTKLRPAVRYNELYRALRQKFLSARGKGQRVDFNWLWSKARVIYRQQQNDADATVKKHVIANFIKRNDLKLRRTQRNKKLEKEFYRDSIMKWHSTLRERLVKSGKKDSYDPVYGGFMPTQRFNVDQSPLPFAIDTKKTYELIEPKNPENRNKKIWVSQPGSGLEKRQCTLQVCFRPEGEQPKVGIIFRGQGKRISEVEKSSWHPEVDVFFQKNAWADTEFCVKWVEQTLQPIVENRFVLFLDNLTGQISDDFKKSRCKSRWRVLVRCCRSHRHLAACRCRLCRAS